jgi:SAM-dependent methyltransferase
MNRSAEEIATAFWRQRSRSNEPAAARFHPEHTPIDQDWIAGYLKPDARVLDLGCGTCTLANWLVGTGATVLAVDREPEFLRHAAAHARMKTTVADVSDFRTSETFDLVLLFGVINFIFSAEARLRLYQRIASYLRPSGRLLLKSQFGHFEEVQVNGYSLALSAQYAAIYPRIADELLLLQDSFRTVKYALYPRYLNPHANTRFFHVESTRV